ncbi:LOW QUALITY PROTEIN: endonuclease G, mitochondrial-like [Pollicipes pollicipes]|uniref:LOW QUALITY PROTEIN: endonuclease G, mitochondrial-like n=1 Tax=Pollicipes pollicipes TaxID=41117 RepID=UPI00188587C1|nr:LOW QUALITY PROTEIN: endonuclease G, mitochondrial-like [Pollicipes pollicipes]
MMSLGRLTLGVSAGLGGWLAGWLAGRAEPVRRAPPGHPLFGTVSAALPIPSDAQAPDVRADQQPAKNAGRVAQIMRFGFPGLDNVRSQSDYVLSYDRRARVPMWVFEHLTAESVRRNDEVDRAGCEFVADTSIHPYFRADNSDYKGSGYDRGHMAAAANHRRSQQEQQETFLLSNMAPQVGVGFNRDKWNDLEMHVRKLCKVYPNVYVCTGPLYLPRREADGRLRVSYEVIGKNQVSVPTHFYKIVVGETVAGAWKLEAYVMPNQVIPNEAPITNYLVPPDVIERAAGLLFFDRMDRSRLMRVNGRKTTWL